MTIADLVNKRQGKFYEESKSLGAQCVWGTKILIKDLFWVDLWNFSGSANNWFVTGSPFDSSRVKIYNTPANHPVAWDVVFWWKSSQLPYGHVWVCISWDTDSFTIIEQNAKSGTGLKKPWDEMTVRKHNYNWVAGRYHYTNQQTPIIQHKTTTAPNVWALKNVSPEDIKLVSQLMADKIYSWEWELTLERLLIIIARVYAKTS